MKNALISPNDSVSYVSSWIDSSPPKPVITIIANAKRVAEVADKTFEVASPLFWVDCADDVVADQFYYDSVSTIIIQIPPPATYPTNQSISTGAQTL
jgi:hypothetical protein